MAVSMPQIWFAKIPLPETVAQCFVMAGVLAWLVATARGAPRWACAAGWFLGLACFAKVDLIVLLSVFLLAVVALRLLSRARPDGPPLLLPLLGAFGLLVAHNLGPYLIFDSHYKPYVAYLIRTSEVLGLLRESAPLQAGAALAAGLLVAAGVVGLRRPAERWPRRVWGLAAVGAIVVYGAAYVTATTGRLDETIAWLSWYFSWPVLGLGGLGLAGLGLAGRAAAPPGLVFAGLLLGVVGLQYLYDPLEPGMQIGSMRRYVPVVLPLTMLFAALTAVGLLARVPAAKYRAGLTLAAGALLVGLVARPSLALIGQPMWDDPLAPVARLFPERAVVLMSPDRPGDHQSPLLVRLLRRLHPRHHPRAPAAPGHADVPPGRQRLPAHDRPLPDSVSGRRQAAAHPAAGDYRDYGRGSAASSARFRRASSSVPMRMAMRKEGGPSASCRSRPPAGCWPWRNACGVCDPRGRPDGRPAPPASSPRPCRPGRRRWRCRCS